MYTGTLHGLPESTMLLHATDDLCAWNKLEDCPTLSTIRDFLQTVPDQSLLAGLVAARGRGRDDFPVARLWHVVLLTIALRHVFFNAMLAELHRNPALCRLINIHNEDEIPDCHNLSRFLDVLGQEPHLSALRDIFNVLAQCLGVAIPELGQHTAGDATALSGRAKKDTAAVAAEVKQGLPQPSGGRKEYKDDEGHVTKVVEWFGYKLHLLVDVKHEIALAYNITDTKVGDNEQVPALVEQACANLPAERIKTLAYDKAADDEKVHETLHTHGIKPLIQNRALWKSEPERVLGGRYPLNLVHDESGTLSCYDTISEPPVRHKMSYVGYEKDRETVRYRCPARHEGWVCPSDAKCNEDRSYGLTVRLPCTEDLRRFPPIPRATLEFERLYKGRTAVERVNARLKIFWGADDGNVTGSRRFHAQVGVVMIVHLVFATLLAKAPRWEGTLGQTRLGPIAKALRQPEPEAAAA
jgi:Transposase DDE domain